MPRAKPIDPEIRDYISYDPDTGDFHWIQNSKGNGKKRKGDKAGFFHEHKSGKGYYQIRFNRTSYNGNRLAFFLMGYEIGLDLVVIPLDGDASNLRFDNLKVVSREVMQLTRKPRSDSITQQKNITKTVYGTYQVGVKGHWKNYKTLKEAITFRDKITDILIAMS